MPNGARPYSRLQLARWVKSHQEAQADQNLSSLKKSFFHLNKRIYPHKKAVPNGTAFFVLLFLSASFLGRSLGSRFDCCRLFFLDCRWLSVFECGRLFMFNGRRFFLFDCSWLWFFYRGWIFFLQCCQILFFLFYNFDLPKLIFAASFPNLYMAVIFQSNIQIYPT